MKTAIVTDTNSGITRAEAEKLHIYMVAMPVIIDGEVYYEGKNMTEEQFYESLARGQEVSTSQPSPGEVMELWDTVLREGYEELVYIPMSSGLSESCNTAKNLAKDYDGKVQVVDNHRISVTQKSSVLDAVRLAKAGETAAAIREKLEQGAYDSTIYVAVDTLEYLKKGGRVTAAGAALGAVFNIKPILSIQGEKLDAFAKVRGMKKCEARMIAAVKDDIAARFPEGAARLRIMTAGSDIGGQQAEEWRALAAAEFPGAEVTYNPLSLSIGCHVGPGALGIGVSRVIG